MISTFAPVVQQYKARANVEIELRLGKISKGKFDTNIGRARFERIARGLHKYQGWESIKKSHTTSYIKGDVRVVDDEDTGKTICQKKSKLKKVDHGLKDQPLDVRLCVSTETEVPRPGGDVEFDDMRVKHRESFVRKNLSIDLTRVTGNPEDQDSEDTELYEVELEIVDPKAIADSGPELENLLHKVLDVLKLLV